MMYQRLVHLWQHKRPILLVFVGVVAIFFYFAAKTISGAVYWMDPAHQDQTLAGWMTPRYVARSYDLPPNVLAPALFLTRDTHLRRQSLDAIAADNGITLAELQDRINAAASQWRATQIARDQ